MEKWEIEEGVFLVNKPSGITSFDVIRKLRKKWGIKKIGHAGTLDPMASGLLIVATDTHTKKLVNYIKLDKTYTAEILLGVKTNTGDIDGEIIKKEKIKNIETKDIELVIKNIIGKDKLQVPKYSAIKQGGQPLYKKARKGEKFEPPKKEMVVHKAKIIEINVPYIKVEFSVSSGTYIRTLAELIGEKLNTIATLSKLKRTQIGKYKLENALDIK